MANVVWTKEDILTLLEAYTDRYRQFNIGNFRPQDWDYVLISVNANKQAGMSDKTRQQVKNKMENMKKKYRQEKGAQRVPGHRSKWSYYINMDRIFGNNPRVVGTLDIENPLQIDGSHSSEPAPLRIIVKSEEGCSPSTPVIQVRPSIDLKESEELFRESPCPAEDEDTPGSAETPRATSAQVEDAPGIHSNLSARRGKKRRHNSYYSPAKALAGTITKLGELCTQLERDRAEREERRAEREERRQKENADREERILKMQMDMQLRLAELFTLGQNRGLSGGEEVKK